MTIGRGGASPACYAGVAVADEPSRRLLRNITAATQSVHLLTECANKKDIFMYEQF